MRNNNKLHIAKNAKNDEFYTMYADIENEVSHYDIKGMSIYCPIDDYRWSNFVKYFKDNFHKLGITKLCSTNFDIGEGAYKYVYDGENEEVIKLKGNGDFRSRECTDIKDEYDCVITNPPFSLFRDFVKWLNGEILYENSLWE